MMFASLFGDTHTWLSMRVWSLLWMASAALSWVTASRAWHLRLLNKITKWFRNNTDDILIWVGHRDWVICTLVPICLKESGNYHAGRLAKTTQHAWLHKNLTNTKAAVSPMQIITCTWYVALVQNAPKGAWSATDGILYASCRKLLPAASTLYQTRDLPWSAKLCRCYVMHDALVCVKCAGAFFRYCTFCSQLFYFLSHHNMRPLALAGSYHWHKSEPNEAICMLDMSSVRFTTGSVDTVVSSST